LNVPVKALDLLEEEDEEVVLLAEVELLTEELLLLVGLAEVRWCRGMASVGLVTIAYTTKKEDGKEEREDAKVVSMVSLLVVWFSVNSVRCGAALPNDQRCVWSGRRVEERGRFWLESTLLEGL
jgi:hypothetical protein